MTVRSLAPAVLALAAIVPATGCRRRPPPPPPESADSTLATFVEVDTLTVDDYSSRIRWTGLGFTDVRFSKLRGQAILRGDSLVGLSLVLDATSLVQSSTVRSATDPRGPQYMDAARYPEVTFALDRVTPDTASATTLVVGGTLTLWGVTRPLSFPASVRITSTPIGTEVRRSLALNASLIVPTAEWDSTGAHRTGPIDVRVNLVARPKGAPPPAVAMRAAQRYQDSLRALYGPGATGDSATGN